MSAALRNLGRVTRSLATASAILWAPQAVEAQVGLSSGLTQVTLVARVAPRGSIQGVSAERETGRAGGMRESSVTVRMSANTGYRLVVRRTAEATSRVWVRAVSGEFQELRDGSSVTVAQDSHCAGEWEREVRYRIEAADETTALPVRYEVAINPVL